MKDHRGHGGGDLSLWQETARAFSMAVAELTAHLRQHHGERDLARLGELVTERGAGW